MLRMKNERTIKQITLGWPVILEDQRKHRQTTTDYYRKAVERTGLDYDCIEDLVMDSIISDQNPLIIPTTNYTCSKTILIMYDNL